MTTVTQPSTPVKVLAVWVTRHGCEKCQSVRERYHAAVVADDGKEVALEIDPDIFVKLAGRATEDDYRDGGYIGFAQPLFFPEALS